MLLSTTTHTVDDHDGINNVKYNDDDDATMADINESNSGSPSERESFNNGLCDGEAEDLE